MKAWTRRVEEKNSSLDVMPMLGLNETLDMLAIANSVSWYCHLLWYEIGYFLSAFQCIRL